MFREGANTSQQVFASGNSVMPSGAEPQGVGSIQLSLKTAGRGREGPGVIPEPLPTPLGVPSEHWSCEV